MAQDLWPFDFFPKDLEQLIGCAPCPYFFWDYFFPDSTTSI